MTPISHALLPVVLGARWIPKTGGIPSLRLSGLVAFGGTLPDLLSPHLELEARYYSLSHSLWAWIAFAFVAAGASFCFRRIPKPIWALCIAAYGLHLACDAITGGVALFNPFSRTIHGGGLLPLWTWGASDALLLFYCYFTYRWLPLRRRLKARERAATP